MIPGTNVKKLTELFEGRSKPQTAANKPAEQLEYRGRDTQRSQATPKVLYAADAQGTREKTKSSRSGSRSPEKSLTKSKRTPDGLRERFLSSVSPQKVANVRAQKVSKEALNAITASGPNSPNTSALNLKELKSQIEDLGIRQGSTTPSTATPKESPKKVQFAQHSDTRTSVRRSQSQSPRKPLPKVPSRPLAQAVCPVDEPIRQESAPVLAADTAASTGQPLSPLITPRTTPRSPLAPQPAPKRLQTPRTPSGQNNPQPDKKDKD
jgi:hypothetical protein